MTINVIKQPDGTCVVNISDKEVFDADKDFNVVYSQVVIAHKESYEIQEIKPQSIYLTS